VKLTVDFHKAKWYHLLLVDGDWAVHHVWPTEQDAPAGESAYRDHCPNPKAVIRLAARLGAQLDERAYELIVGRWVLQEQSGMSIKEIPTQHVVDPEDLYVHEGLKFSVNLHKGENP
jgi:hypothetical protein